MFILKILPSNYILNNLLKVNYNLIELNLKFTKGFYKNELKKLYF